MFSSLKTRRMWLTALVAMGLAVLVVNTAEAADGQQAAVSPLEISIESYQWVRVGEAAKFVVNVRNRGNTVLKNVRIYMPFQTQFATGTAHLKSPEMGPGVGAYRLIHTLPARGQASFTVYIIVPDYTGGCMPIEMVGKIAYRTDRVPARACPYVLPHK